MNVSYGFKQVHLLHEEVAVTLSAGPNKPVLSTELRVQSSKKEYQRHLLYDLKLRIRERAVPGF